MDDPFTPAGLELWEEVEGKNLPPLTLNFPNNHGLVLIYSGEHWELFSNAIRQAVDRVQEALLERKTEQ